MIFKTGEKLLNIERRYFTDDLRRHFVGEILSCTDHAIRVRGCFLVPPAASFMTYIVYFR